MDRLRKTYCGKIGVEYMHISDPDQKAWIQERIEHVENRTEFTVEGRRIDPGARRRGRGSGALSRREVRRHQALRPRRRRIDDPRHRADPEARRPARHPRRGDRHAASRPAQHARARPAQELHRAVLGVPGPLLAARGNARLGRREVPSRRLGRPRVRRHHHPCLAVAQPFASRSRRSRGAGQGARQAGPARRHRTRPGHGHPDARRRGLRRPGAGGREPRPLRSRRLPHRRHRPFHRQQPDRLHHPADLFALGAVLHGGRQDRAGADPARERRRSRSRGPRLAHRHRVPPALQARHRHRHVLLPTARPQRVGRADVHPAADVQDDRRPQVGERSLCRAPGSRRHRDAARSRGPRRGAAREARQGARGGDPVQAQQGRLAGGSLGRPHGRAGRGGPQGRHRRRARPAPGGRPRHFRTAQELRSQSQDCAPAAGEAQDHRDRQGYRLGDRRGAGLGHACWPKARRCG